MLPKLIDFQQRLNGLYDDSETKSLYYYLLESILECNKTTLLLNGESKMTHEKEEIFWQMTNRLSKGEPLQYILGKTIFCNHTFLVNPSVLIPRPETEELVDWMIQNGNSFHTILDIGTGSGCIAISLKKELFTAEVYAMDISAEALQTASRNATYNDVELHFIQDDILHPQCAIPEVDAIVSNPPYITEQEKASMHENVLNHEPSLALFVPDEDPLRFYRSIALYGQRHLKPNGWLYFEINEQFGTETKEMLESYNYHTVTIRKDINGKERMIRCQKR